MKPTPPLRFLALAVGGWICVRAAWLAPDRSPAGIDAAPLARPIGVAAAAAPAQALAAPAPSGAAARGQAAAHPAAAARNRAALAASAAPAAAVVAMSASIKARGVLRADAEPAAAIPFVSPPRRPDPSREDRAGRWSGSAWLLARSGGGGDLAQGGALGGSQAGARLLYRLEPRLALSGRLYIPIADRRGAEAAAGIEWQPARDVPLRLLAERRQAIGGRGRSAFVLLGHGGVSARRVTSGVLLDLYVQAGMAGLRRRDLFADGSARLTRPIGRDVAIGGGLWGAAQPGAARLDLGPSVTVRLPAGDQSLRVAADWRFRLAGDAAPGSGPALTLATDF